jgi:uncharacterized protein
MTGGRSLVVPRVETHVLTPRGSDQTYQVEVMQPMAERDSHERFPTLYLTDGNLLFGAARAISHSLQFTGEVRRFILVGIGYPGDNPFAGTVVRGRDLSWADIRGLPDSPRTSSIEGVPGFAAGHPDRLGGERFLAFIRDELIGVIDSTYPTVRGDRAYFGHSAGGGLGLYALFAHAGLFSRYILSSPAVSYAGHDFALDLARAFIASGKHLQAKLILTVGGQEEGESNLAEWHMVSSLERLAAALAGAGIRGFELQSEVIAGETHMSVWPVTFSRGIRAIYGLPGQSPRSVLE